MFRVLVLKGFVPRSTREFSCALAPLEKTCMTPRKLSCATPHELPCTPPHEFVSPCATCDEERLVNLQDNGRARSVRETGSTLQPCQRAFRRTTGEDELVVREVEHFSQQHVRRPRREPSTSTGTYHSSRSSRAGAAPPAVSDTSSTDSDKENMLATSR